MIQALIFVAGWVVGLFSAAFLICVVIGSGQDVDDEDYYDSFEEKGEK